MIDEYTGKKIISPLDFTTPERAIINMLAIQGKTVEEAANFLSDLSGALKSPAHQVFSEALNRPLSEIADSLEF
jgi:hypothetical protein